MVRNPQTRYPKLSDMGRVSEGERVGGGGGRGCYLPWLWLLIDGLPITHVTQDRTRHPGFPAVQLRLRCDQICTGSESLHVKYGAKEKKRNGNHWEP